MMIKDKHKLAKNSVILIVIACSFSLIQTFGNTSISLATTSSTASDYASTPPFVTNAVPPLVMLVMGKGHKLFYEAYNDASDLDGDGNLDVGYNPAIEYYGYFDSYKYYQYSSNRFEPVGITVDKKVPAAAVGSYWSGDFLNYLSMTRMDCLRKVLYGGYRSTDTSTETVLERAHVPQDAHSWGKEYLSISHDGYDIREYTPLNLPQGPSRHLFANTTRNSFTDPPELRVLEDSGYRIWNWVAREVYVAGDQMTVGGQNVNITDNSHSTITGGDLTGPEGTYGTASANPAGLPVSGGASTDLTDGGSNGTASDSGQGGNPSAEQPRHAFDDTSNTKWLLFGPTGGSSYEVWLQYEFDTGQKVSGYSFTTANDADKRDPKSWTLEASNDGSTWTTLDSIGNGNLPAGRRAKTPDFICSTPAAIDYTKYRFVFTARKGNINNDLCGGRQCMQIAEVELLGTGTISDTSASLAFDDDPDNKWVTTEDPSLGFNNDWIQFHLDAAAVVKRYTMTTSNYDENWDPQDWTLEGSNDGSTWIVVDTVINGGLPSNRKDTKEFIIAPEPATAFSYYRFMITETKGGTGTGVQIAEIEISEETGTIPATATVTNYNVRVKVCDITKGLEPNSREYPGSDPIDPTDNVFKPTGLLQQHGESGNMHFGLLSGSYENNMSGGVLRKNISSITDEINPDTGEFKYMDTGTVKGIIKTIDKIRILDYSYSGHRYGGGLISDRKMNENEFPDWGNPIGEMMYETLRYFAGQATPTNAFKYNAGDDDSLGLPNESSNWADPWATYPYCSKAFMLILSDIYPSYDSDQLPGVNSEFGSVSEEVIGNASSALNVNNLADVIFTEEGITGNYFIGQQGTTYDRACSPKTVSSFGDIRGLCPEEPTKEGSYYSAAVANYGFKEDLSTEQKEQNVMTYSVGLASPLPTIEIPVGGGMVSLVPFGKKVSTGGGIINGNAANGGEGGFQPTMTIGDYFVEKITKYNGTFRVNFEDGEQGSDFDMDAVVKYNYQVYRSDGITPATTDAEAAEVGATVVIKVECVYANMGHKAHMGYIISGTTHDGVYLEIRDTAHSQADDINYDYFLDTPHGEYPGGNWDDDTGLPDTHVRTFSPGATAGATTLTNPLWYAAKWGAYEDNDGNGMPTNSSDATDNSEWDKDNDGDPDTYFYVTNPLKLEEQLNKSFADILKRSTSGTAASVISNTRSGSGAIYQSIFFPEYQGGGKSVKWAGEVHALFVDDYGNMLEDTNGDAKLEPGADRYIVFTTQDGKVEVTKYQALDNNHQPVTADATCNPCNMENINYLWSAKDWLNSIADADILVQRTYNTAEKKRYIFTLIDDNENMVANAGEVIPFVDTDTDLYPYILNQPQNVIKYIRGEDQTGFRERKVTYDGTGEKTWRLGDIVYSTPTFVGRPSEGYHLLYEDSDYAIFQDHYKNRRGVVYAGANDGMFHAFNGGFFDYQTNEFSKQSSGETAHDLGAELWAYVPYNLLPHLYWLTELDYDHIYYNDLKPRIFDAKIFPADGDHPGGWGTVLVGGMRLGGGEIDVTEDFDGNGLPYETRSFRSSYFILDITNPEIAPTVLAEIHFDDLGFTTCYPTVIPMRDKQPDGSLNANQWYLVFGSGPAGPNALTNIESDQPGKLYIIDLNELGKVETSRDLYVVDSSNNKTLFSSIGVPGNEAFVSFDADPDAFISDLVTIDYDLDYNADAIYFGTISGDPISGWGGQLRRVVIDNDTDTTNWIGDSVLFNAGKPIMAAPSVAVDPDLNRWVYVGTGRFFTRADVSDNTTQSYYGIKEPFIDLRIDGLNNDGDGEIDEDDEGVVWTWAQAANLMDVGGFKVYEGDGQLTDSLGNPMANPDPTTWAELKIEIADNRGGWYRDLSQSLERNLGQAVILGELLTFTTYIPSSEVCTFEGTSNLHAYHYLTGTPFYRSVIGYVDGEEKDFGEGDKERVRGNITLGSGLAVTPNIHIGRETGSKAFIQTSSGAIETIEQLNPGQTKSGVSSWREKE